MSIKIHHGVLVCILASLLVVTGCTQGNSPTNTEATPSPTATESVASPSPASPSAVAQVDPQFRGLPQLVGQATVEMVVKGSPVTIQVDGTSAPITAGNFVDLVNRGVYNGLPFHRVVREPQPFVVQGGDPQGRDPNFPVDRLGTGSFIDPTTSLPRYIPLEIQPEEANQPIYSQTFEMAGITKSPKLKHTRGAVAMARSNPPDSASSQFYVALTDLDFLDGNYAVFGYVTNGMEVIDQVQQGDRITSARVTAGIENLKPGGG